MRRLLLSLITTITTTLVVISTPVWAADDPSGKKILPSLGWSLDQVLDNTNLGTVTGTNVAFTDLVSCASLQTDAGGNLVCVQGSGVSLDEIDDPGANTSLDLTSFVVSLTSTLDGGSILSLTDTDTDLASDTIWFDLNSYDIDDVNGIFLRARSDTDGTPTTVFEVAQDGVTSGVPITISGSSGSAGYLDLYEDPASGTNKTRFITQAMASDITYTLPADDGDAGEQLQTNGSGTLSWELSGSGSSPGGSIQEVQFNDGGGTFGGDSALTYDKTSDILTAVNVYANTIVTGVTVQATNTVTGLLVVDAPNIENSAGGALVVRDSLQSTGTVTGSVVEWAGTFPVSILNRATSAYTLRLPVDDGTSGQVLSTDGLGTLSWATAGAGSGDIEDVGDVSSGAAFTGTQGTSLTFNAATDGVLSYATQDFELDSGDITNLSFEFDDTPTGYGQVSFQDAGAEKWAFGVNADASTDTDDKNVFFVYQITDQGGSTVNLYRLRISDGGLLGIGAFAGGATVESLLHTRAADTADATLTLDADRGDDNADTWFIESEAADNDLAFVNHTTENMKLSATGNLTVLNTVTGTQVVDTQFVDNTAGGSLVVRDAVVATGAVTGLTIAYTQNPCTGSTKLSTDSNGNLVCVNDTSVKCGTFENLVAADDNIFLFTALQTLTVHSVSCRTSGFTTQPTLTFEDGSGNAMTGSVTCNATETQDWTPITVGGVVTAEESIRFDTTNTTDPITGTQANICFSYTHAAN